MFHGRIVVEVDEEANRVQVAGDGTERVIVILPPTYLVRLDRCPTRVGRPSGATAHAARAPAAVVMAHGERRDFL